LGGEEEEEEEEYKVISGRSQQLLEAIFDRNGHLKETQWR